MKRKQERGAGSAGKNAKQSHPGSQSSLLAANKYAPLAMPEVEKKEKMPPFYVRGVNGDLKAELDVLIKRGLKASIKLCTEGYKVIVPSQQHFNAVEEYLRQKNAQYFTHDIPAKKPFKVVLRGLYDMGTDELNEYLTQLGLKVEAIHKIRRKQKDLKFRDQLYLVHLENGTTCLRDLKAIRAVANVIVEWERYRPIHRDVTQCTKCFNFGHGARNCHMNPRCEKCGANHDAEGCVTDVLIAKCCNCDGDHPSTDRNCPKRAEFIQMRRAAAARRAPQSKQKDAAPNPADFPQFQPPRPRFVVPNLQPLPLNHIPGRGQKQNPGASLNPTPSTSQNQAPGTNHKAEGRPIPPGFRSFAQVTNQSPNAAAGAPSDNPEDGLYTANELFALFQGLIQRLQGLKTQKEQFDAVCKYTLEVYYGS